MTKYTSEQAEKDAVTMAVKLMAASACTAPKARGVDVTKSLIIDGDDLEELATAMERRAPEIRRRLINRLTAAPADMRAVNIWLRQGSDQRISAVLTAFFRPSTLV